MSLKFQYIIFNIFIHIVITGLLFYTFKDDRWYFLLFEIAILISIIISYRLYSRFNQPLTLMKNGVNAIKDEDYNVRFLKTGSNDINELIGVFNTFLDKLRQEKVKTQEQAYFLESIITASPIGMIMLDYDNLVTSVNDAVLKILRVKDINLKRPLSDIDHPVIESLIALEIGDSKIITTGLTQRYKCQVRSVIHLGFRRVFIMIEEMSKELLKNEKAAYGKVIRMMAHEVNNSIGAVNSILQTVLDFGFDERDDEYKESLQVAKERNNELSLFMKKFADVLRLPQPTKIKIEMEDLVRHAKLIMGSLAKEQNINIDVQIKDQNVVIECDSSQIQQVIINAVKNAIESIKKDGNITILLQNSTPQITVIDNGPGIDVSVRDKLFTPFFSTKPAGQGIGLILSREILLSHGAEFRLYSDHDSSHTYFEIDFLDVSNLT
ncbi:MAG: ATP-binding protein [Saprospiraceae bacterium]